jgi:hypothetical protein
MSNNTLGVPVPASAKYYFGGTQFHSSRVPCADNASRRGTAMQDANTYRQYAAECRRLAKTMSEKDGKVMLKMAEAWDGRADEAERIQRKKADGKDQHPTK